MPKPARKTNLVENLVREFPAASSTQLARLLLSRYPGTFSSEASARWYIRYIRGATGPRHKAARARAGGASLFRDPDLTTLTRWHIPAPIPDLYQPVPLPPDVRRWLIIADIHVPFHDPMALDSLLTWATAQRPRFDGLLINGDLTDCYNLSSWLRNPTTTDFSSECSATSTILRLLKDALRPRRFLWKAGNHEYRLDRFLFSHAPELLNVANISLSSILKLDELGIQWIPWGCPLTVGRLHILHGDEYPTAPVSPVNPARGAMLKTLGCTVVAHSHRTSEHSEPTIDGTTMTSWSIGCLCSLHPHYRPIQRWNHGFATLNTHPDWSVINHRILPGGQIK